MFSAPPTIGFDTSALNWLKDDVARRLYGRFHVLLFGMNAEEIVATPSVKAERREVLLTRLEGLLCSGHCLWPPHMILESLISAHFKYPMQFSWQRVSARSMMYEQGIIRRVFTEEDSSQQLEHQNAVQEKFEQIWAGIRPELDAIRSNPATKWEPRSFQDVLPVIRADGGGILWGLGRTIYKAVTKADVDEPQIKAFMEKCPPFRAFAYALCLSWYDRGIRDPKIGPAFGAGRNDMMMSVYLPYCKRFITADEKHERCMREVASVSDINCNVMSYQQFISSLT